MTKETKDRHQVSRTTALIIISLFLFLLFFIYLMGNSGSSSRSSSMEGKKATQGWKDLSMAERKDIYLRVTDFDPGPEADQVTAEMIQKYNISKDDVTTILLKGTFEWGWGDAP